MRRKILVIAGVLVAIIALGVAWRSARRADMAIAERARLAEQQAQATAAVLRATARMAAAQQRGSELQTSLNSLIKSAAAQTAAPAAPAHARAVTQSEVIANDPKVQALSLSEGRANAAIRYAMFFRAAGLSPAQIDQFLENLTRRDGQIMDLRHTAQAQGLTDKDPAIARPTAQMWDDYNAAQRELLGAAGVKQLQDFELSTPLRSMVGDLAGAATMAGVSFTTAQIDQLTQAFTAGSGAKPGRPIDVRTLDWTRLDTAAQAILSPEQMEFFTTTDPDGGWGRYWVQFQRTRDAAKNADTQSPPAKVTSGGP